jgi:hypothetical protein
MSGTIDIAPTLLNDVQITYSQVRLGDGGTYRKARITCTRDFSLRIHGGEGWNLLTHALTSRHRVPPFFCETLLQNCTVQVIEKVEV